MALTLANINIGTLANDGTGDPLRVAFQKINNNFANLSNASPNGPENSIQIKNAGQFVGSSGLLFDVGTNELSILANVIPLSPTGLNIGTNLLPVNTLFVSGSALNVGNINFVESGNVISFPVAGDPVAKASLAGINNVTVLNNLNVGNSTISTTIVETSDNSVGQVIYKCDPTTFKTMEARVTSISTSTLDTQSITLSISKKQDNSMAHYSGHSTIFPSTPLTRYSVDITFGNLQITVSPMLNQQMQHTVEIKTFN